MSSETSTQELVATLQALVQGSDPAAGDLPRRLDSMDRTEVHRLLTDLLIDPLLASVFQAQLAHVDGLLPTAARAARWFLDANLGDGSISKGMRHAAVASVLDEEGDALARTTRAPGELERELQVHLHSLASTLPDLAGLSELSPLRDGLFAPDDAFAKYVAPLGEHGMLLAGKARQASAERLTSFRSADGKPVELFYLWLPPRGSTSARFVTALAKVLWRDAVRPRLAREIEKPPALAMVVHQPVMSLLSRTTELEEREGQQWLRFANEGHAQIRSTDSAAIGADAINQMMVHRGLKLFGSVTAHRLLRWQIFLGHKQAIEGHPDPRVLSVDGGWSTLAHDVLHMKGNKAADEVRDIIEAEDACQLPLPPDGVYSRLLSRSYAPPLGRRRGSIKLILGFHLLPDYVWQLRTAMGSTLEARRALRLVPVLDLPPFTGREREHGAQASFSMALVAYMRDHARELVEHGGVHLDQPTLIGLALHAGLPPEQLPAVLDRWTHDGPDGPAFLCRVEPGRYSLANTHAAAKAFLEEGGRAETQGAEAGKRSASKKRKKIKRLAESSTSASRASK